MLDAQQRKFRNLYTAKFEAVGPIDDLPKVTVEPEMPLKLPATMMQTSEANCIYQVGEFRELRMKEIGLKFSILLDIVLCINCQSMHCIAYHLFNEDIQSKK